MRKLPVFLFRCSLIAFAPMAANAAGTYYNGNLYQSPQRPYGQMQQGGYYNQQRGYNTQGYTAYSGSRFNQTQTTRTMGQRTSQTTVTRETKDAPRTQSSNRGGQNGFWVDGGYTRELAEWRFEMKDAGSILHYDNVNWNVFDINAGYGFNLSNIQMEVYAGFKYGMQAGESPMVDDDITNGGYGITTWVSVDNNGDIDKYLGDQSGHAMSLGTSDGGNMYDFNIGLGLPNIFKWGNVKFTPSVGYRYLKYKLETKKNYGLSVDVISGDNAGCFMVDGEIQCDPAIIQMVCDNNNENCVPHVNPRTDPKTYMEIAQGAKYLDLAGTYYFEQSGVSHSYEVEWAGPYVALDMDYLINQNNAVNAHIELGLPAYTSTGDQPYRYDWEHPKSVEDKAGFGDAMHLGLGANWTTALTNTVSLSLGVTYDYYTVSGADATTYMNGTYYTDLYNKILTTGNGGQAYADEAEMLANNQNARNIKQLKEECPGWVCKTTNEVDSYYKSIGVRVGINAKF